MHKAGGIAAAVVVAVSSLTNSAAADARGWTVCGGSTFATCASVGVAVAGSLVTVRIWNLSGWRGSNPNTVINSVSFTNIGNATARTNTLQMDGPKRGTDNPSKWSLRNDVSPVTPPNVPNSVFLDIVSSTPNLGPNNGIASACGSQPSNLKLWQNPCRAPTSGRDPGYVQLKFEINGTWDLSNTYLTVRGIQGGDNRTYCITGGSNANCFNAVPEPVTMTLMLTGLAGVGGVGLIRRRRRMDVHNG